MYAYLFHITGNTVYKKKHGFQRQIFCSCVFGLGFNPLCLSFLICKFWQRKLPFWGWLWELNEVIPIKHTYWYISCAGDDL